MDLGFRDVFQDFPLNQSIDGDERVISGFQCCGESIGFHGIYLVRG
jgi:hypothetical protein